MANFFTKQLNPDWYHGKGHKAPFFEGWYYKLVNKAQDRKFAIIPGVFIAKDPKETHAFIQVLDGVTGTARYHAVKHFEAVDDAFNVTIGKSNFSRDHIHLNHADGDGILSGDLTFNGLTPFPVTLTSPGIMGWYGWLPFMECNHGLVSMDHELQGTLNMYDETVDFSGGRGYIEKDWGTNFPAGYIWMQSNHFADVGTSLSASIAVIPSLGRKFPGFIIAFMHNGQLYRFATYNGSKVSRLHVDDKTVEWIVYNKNQELAITAQRAEGGLLKGPEQEAMHMRVDETMKATVHMRLSILDGFRKTLIYEGEGKHTGLEVVGDLSMLLRL